MSVGQSIKTGTTTAVPPVCEQCNRPGELHQSEPAGNRYVCQNCHTEATETANVVPPLVDSPSPVCAPHAHTHAHTRTEGLVNQTGEYTVVNAGGSLASNLSALGSRASTLQSGNTEGSGEEESQEAFGDSLLAEYRGGRQQPLQISLPDLPEDASPLDREVAEHFRLMRGLRLANSDSQPMLFSRRWVARTLQPARHERAVGFALTRLREWGVIVVAATYHFEGKRIDAYCYVPGVVLDDAPGTGFVQAPVSVEGAFAPISIEPPVEVGTEQVMREAVAHTDNGPVLADDAAAAGNQADEGGSVGGGGHSTIIPVSATSEDDWHAYLGGKWRVEK